MASASSAEIPSSQEALPKPLFSVIWYGRNRLASAEETLSALRAQSNQDYELVVEDTGSTDGTIEAFRTAAAADPRIRVRARWASRPGDTLIDALRRCRGDFIAICPSEGHLRFNALETAIQAFHRDPTAGGICAPGFLADSEPGKSRPPDIVTLLFSPFRPFLPAAFFRRSALLFSGLEDDDWSSEAVDLELPLRLCTDHGLATIFERVVDCPPSYPVPDFGDRDVDAMIDDRLRLVSAAFSPNGFFGGKQDHLLLECKANQLSNLWTMLESNGRAKEASYNFTKPLLAIVAGLDALLTTDHRTLSSLARLLNRRKHGLGMVTSSLERLVSWASRRTGRLPVHVGYSVWNAPWLGTWLKQKAVQPTSAGMSFDTAAAYEEEVFTDIYRLAGYRYEARGQIDLAIKMWDRARPPDDADIDSLACQAMLKSPSATDESLARRQLEWTRRHLGHRPFIPPAPRATMEKIRIGYFCAFMDGDTMRNMMGNVIAFHDRSEFEIFGYAPRLISDDIRRVFDHWRLTPAPPAQTDSEQTKGDFYTDEEFAELVRSDCIDVFVELTGFSPGHRFGAMSLRCAPVQVSFLNHTGTSQVPNVDYVLSDEICHPRETKSQQYYSERIYRLPGCFFCFDYTTSNEPDIVDPPLLKNGYITFGCFGTGGKIGTELIEMWARLLARVPGSILHLQNPQLSSAANRRFMKVRFAQFGINSDRLSLEGGVDRPTLLQVYAQIDISLDTWPYCGGNTIAESCWHGVPVVTYRGSRFSSMYGASLLTAAGCPDLIASSPQEYVDIAAKLASDPARLVELRRSLRRKSLDHGLADSRRFARSLEAAYKDMLGNLGATSPKLKL